MTSKNKLYSKKVPKNLDDARIDLALVGLFPDLSRGSVRKYIDEGNVFLNKKRIWIAKYKIQTGDLVEINLENGDNKKIEFGLKNILFENENFLVVNKPAGIVVEDSKNAYPIFKMLQKLDQIHSLEEYFVVHRIDKETSGLLLIAKNEQTQGELIRLWTKKAVQKTYQCLTLNTPKKMQGSITLNIGQHAGRNQYGTAKSFGEGGKTALTNYKVLAVLNKGAASILSIEPKTGRSHQIRVHLASIECPIIGDKIYGSKFRGNPFYQAANRQMLHASQLIFELFGVKYNFHAPAPSDFNQLSKFIKSSNIDAKPKTLSKVKRTPTVKTKLRVSKRRKPGETAMRNKIFGGKK